MSMRRRILTATALAAASLAASTTAWAAPGQHGPRSERRWSARPRLPRSSRRRRPSPACPGPRRSTSPSHSASRIFKSGSSRICASVQGWPKDPFGTGQPNIYVSLMHYHPTTGVYASENRPPIWFPLNGQWYVYCWTGQNTANQWSLWLHDVKWTYGAYGNVKASN